MSHGLSATITELAATACYDIVACARRGLCYIGGVVFLGRSARATHINEPPARRQVGNKTTMVPHMDNCYELGGLARYPLKPNPSQH